MFAAADPAAQLVKLGQAEPVGPIQNQGVDIGQIQAGFDDGGADQHIGLAVGKGDHHFL